MIHLREFQKLRKLSLGETDVTSPNLAVLATLPSLQWLRLSDTLIDDRALVVDGHGAAAGELDRPPQPADRREAVLRVRLLAVHGPDDRAPRARRLVSTRRSAP